MTHAEFSITMYELECIINKLTKGLTEECDNTSFRKEDGDVDIDRYMQARNIVAIAQGLTTAKLSIHYMHDLVYGKE